MTPATLSPWSPGQNEHCSNDSNMPAKLSDGNVSGISGIGSKNTTLPGQMAEQGACVPPQLTAVESVESPEKIPHSGGKNKVIDTINDGDGVSGGDDVYVDDEADTNITEVPEALRLVAQYGTADDPFKPGGKWYSAGRVKSRTFMITQQCFHPAVGALISRGSIEQALSKMGGHRHAYILHDRDVYAGADDIPPELIGTPKAEHFHIVLQTDNVVTIAALARRFGVPPQYIQTYPKRAFPDLLEYLTHEHPNQVDKGKCLYSDDEVTANFDWRAVVEQRQTDRVKRENAGIKFDEICGMVLSGQKRPLDIQREYPAAYAKRGVAAHLQRLRDDYLLAAEPPATVTTFLLWGEGSAGKSLMAMGLARHLFPDSSKPFFEVGARGVSLDDYDGEPVVILNDFRPSDLLELAGDRGGVFRMLDPHRQPGQSSILNKKYGRVKLLNSVFIITTPDDHITFLDGLSGEYSYINRLGQKIEHKSENKSQAYRRVPVVIPIRAGDFDILINRGVVDGTAAFQEYYEHRNFRQNLRALHERCEAIEDEAERWAVIREVESRKVAPIIEKTAALAPKKVDSIDAASVLDEFHDVGSQFTPPDPYSPSEVKRVIRQAAIDWASRYPREIYAPLMTERNHVPYVFFTDAAFSHLNAVRLCAEAGDDEGLDREILRFFGQPEFAGSDFLHHAVGCYEGHKDCMYRVDELENR